MLNKWMNVKKGEMEANEVEIEFDEVQFSFAFFSLVSFVLLIIAEGWQCSNKEKTENS